MSGLLESSAVSVRLAGVADQGSGPEPSNQEFPVPRHSEETLSAIKNAVDIIALVGEYVPLRRAGNKFNPQFLARRPHALTPFNGVMVRQRHRRQPLLLATASTIDR